MAGMAFKRATKKAARLRFAIGGPSGAGKTWTALAIASALGKRIAVIDTERGSASLYSDAFAFDVLDLGDHHPERYVEAIHLAEREGYEVIVIDSLSHAWMGKGGALEQVDIAAKKAKSGNNFTAWRDVTPMHNALVDSMLSSSAHIIATLRAKTEWVLEDDGRGKKVPRKIGLAWVQRDGLEYEFTIVGDIDLDHNLVVSKTRWSKLAGAVISKPNGDLGREILAWLNEGDAAPALTSAPPPVAPPKAPDPAPLAPVPSRAEMEAERDRVKGELDALATMFGGWPAMLGAVGAQRPAGLAAAKDLLERVKRAHAAKLEAQRAVDVAFDVPTEIPPKGHVPPLRVVESDDGERAPIDSEDAQPYVPRPPRGVEVRRPEDEPARAKVGGMTGREAQARGRGSKRPAVDANPDRPSDSEWAEFWARVREIDATHGSAMTEAEHRDEIARVFGLASTQDATRTHLRKYVGFLDAGEALEVTPEETAARDAFMESRRAAGADADVPW